MFHNKSLFFFICALCLVNGQFLSSDGILSFADLKIQNEKLSGIIQHLRTETAYFRNLLGFQFNRTCNSLHQNYPYAKSGVYELYSLDSVTGTMSPYKTYCDMDTLDGGWTLVYRTVWNFTDTEQLITNYHDFLHNYYGEPDPAQEMAFRVPGKFWADLQQAIPGTVNNIFKFYLRDESADVCSSYEIGEADVVKVDTPLIHGSIDTHWTFPNEISGVMGVTNKGSNAPFGAAVSSLFNMDLPSTGFLTTDHPASAASSCSPTQNVPFQMSSCCLNCLSYSNPSLDTFPDGKGHPMVNTATILDYKDLHGRTRSDVVTMGGCTWRASLSYYGGAVTEYYIR
eukprot:GCRY01003769.1.p1 GENE.GCRY01003769.1~~GCRY01003769.1.p1  ORF type:complete len:341 (+),score=17.60 GCRY01003769.1:147-1169(+)